MGTGMPHEPGQAHARMEGISAYSRLCRLSWSEFDAQGLRIGQTILDVAVIEPNSRIVY